MDSALAWNVHKPDWTGGPVVAYSFKAKEILMLRWALVFLVVAIIAAIFGFGGIAGDALWIARILALVFIVLFVVSLIIGRGTPPAG
jgi:uncharacterized membrane protein YtjA (UPF0391 family)